MPRKKNPPAVPGFGSLRLLDGTLAAPAIADWRRFLDDDPEDRGHSRLCLLAGVVAAEEMHASAYIRQIAEAKWSAAKPLRIPNVYELEGGQWICTGAVHKPGGYDVPSELYLTELLPADTFEAPLLNYQERFADEVVAELGRSYYRMGPFLIGRRGKDLHGLARNVKVFVCRDLGARAIWFPLPPPAAVRDRGA